MLSSSVAWPPVLRAWPPGKPSGGARPRLEDYQHDSSFLVSVNLSAKQLARPGLAEAVEDVLKRTGLEGYSLMLDVTETVFVKALEGNTAALDRLRAKGVKIFVFGKTPGSHRDRYPRRLPRHGRSIRFLGFDDTPWIVLGYFLFGCTDLLSRRQRSNGSRGYSETISW
jgi:hypothetical protein